MRDLHGEHIFALPFRANDFPLSAAVARRAHELAAETELLRRIEAAYDRYRGLALALVHGDVQPTNVLVAAGAPKLLDAEIAHMGDPAFDVGQLAGHLWLRALARGDARAAAPARERALVVLLGGLPRRPRLRFQRRAGARGDRDAAPHARRGARPRGEPRRDSRCARSRPAAPGCSRRPRIPRCYRLGSMPGPRRGLREIGLHFFLWLLLGGWIGAWVTFGALVAPTAFRALPSTELAGQVVGPVISALHGYGMAAGLLLALLAWILRRGALLVLIPLAAAAACAWSELVVTPRIAAIRPLMAGPDGTPELAARFAHLHRLSVAIFLFVGVSTLVLLAAHVLADARRSAGGPALGRARRRRRRKSRKVTGKPSRFAQRWCMISRLSKILFLFSYLG